MTSEQLCKKYAVLEPPVPVERIAIGEGIDLVFVPTADDISGAIIRKHGRVTIAVNPSHSKTRQRFTIAHELAHYFLHFSQQELFEHVDGDFRVNWRDMESSKAVKWEEIEANRFAAELLMPESFLQRDLSVLSNLRKKEVDFLAKRYRVSPLAMQIRLTNLGLVPNVLEFM